MRTSSGSGERRDAVTELVDLGLLGVALAELGLDRLELLAEEVLALALLHLGLDLRLDLRAELEHLELAGEDPGDHAEPLLDVDRLEDLLPLLDGDRPHRRGDEVGERARVVDVRGGELQLLGQIRRETDDARELALHVADERFDLGPLDQHVGYGLELGDEVRVDGDAFCDPHAMQAADEDALRPVGDLDHLVDDRDRPDLVDVVPVGRLDRGVLGGDQGEQAVAGDDVVDQAHRALLPDRKRGHRLREDDHLLERQHRQDGRQLDLVGLRLVGQLEGDVAHERCTSIVIRPPIVTGACSATGSVIVTMPPSNSALAPSGSTSSGSRTCRRNGP